MTNDEILLAQKDFFFSSISDYFATPLVIEEARDQYVWDSDGKQYLDFFGRIVTIDVDEFRKMLDARLTAAARQATSLRA